QVGRDDLERVARLVTGMIARPVTAQVGGHRVPTALGQGLEEVGEVLLGPREAVHQQDRTTADARLRDRQPHIAEPDVSRIRRHRHSVWGRAPFGSGLGWTNRRTSRTGSPTDDPPRPSAYGQRGHAGVSADATQLLLAA